MVAGVLGSRGAVMKGEGLLLTPPTLPMCWEPSGQNKVLQMGQGPNIGSQRPHCICGALIQDGACSAHGGSWAE